MDGFTPSLFFNIVQRSKQSDSIITKFILIELILNYTEYIEYNILYTALNASYICVVHIKKKK